MRRCHPAMADRLSREIDVSALVEDCANEALPKRMSRPHALGIEPRVQKDLFDDANGVPAAKGNRAGRVSAGEEGSRS